MLLEKCTPSHEETYFSGCAERLLWETPVKFDKAHCAGNTRGEKKREKKGGEKRWGGGRKNMGADLKLEELLSHIPDIYSTEGHSEKKKKIFKEII